MEPRTDTTTIRRRGSKLLRLSVASAAFFLPIILAAAYVKASGPPPPPPPPDFTVSQNTDGIVANLPSEGGFVSGNGTQVAFSSRGTNLFPDGSLPNWDWGPKRGVFIHDLSTGVTSSVAHWNTGFGYEPVLSHDGEFVAFVDREGWNRDWQLYVRDVATGTDELIVEGSKGLWNTITQPTISSDGRFVAFTSFVPLGSVGDTNNPTDIYLKDRQTGSLERVSMDGLLEWENWSHSPKLSGDGSMLVYQLGFSDLTYVIVQNRTASGYDYGFEGQNPSIDFAGLNVAYQGSNGIYVSNISTSPSTTQNVSIDSGGNPSSAPCDRPIISGNGQFVAFRCDDPMTPYNAFNQVYVRDLDNNTISLASINAAGQPANQEAIPISISYDGKELILQSTASNLGQDSDGNTQVFHVSSNYWRTCPPQQVCTPGQPPPPPPPGCVPKTCQALGAECGAKSDTCGVTLNCGACSAGQTCSSNRCKDDPPPPPKCAKTPGTSCGSGVPPGCGPNVVVPKVWACENDVDVCKLLAPGLPGSYCTQGGQGGYNNGCGRVFGSLCQVNSDCYPGATCVFLESTGPRRCGNTTQQCQGTIPSCWLLADKESLCLYD